jgi:sensor histidine kinase YesM
MKKDQLFSNQILLAQAAAILIWLMISVIQWSNNPKSSPGIWIPMIVRGVESFSIFITSTVLIFSIEKLSIKFKQSFVLVFMIVLIYLVAILANILSLLTRGIIGFSPPPIDSFFFIQSLHFYIPLTLVLVFVEIIRYKKVAQIEYENKLIAEKSLHQSQWLMLRYQVNPHFLFNVLNTIRSLIGLDDEKARKTVTELSDYFRYSLSVKVEYNITIAQEIKAVNNYLEIQKIRFQEKISVKLKIEQDVMKCLIPVFTIQTLIENAVKYGLKTNKDILKIVVHCNLKGEVLNISVKNSGSIVHSKSKNESGISIGIENLKKRLNLMYPENSFDLFEDKGFVTARIIIRNYKKIEMID